MQEFRIRENGFKEVKPRLIWTTSIMFTLIFVMVILVPAFVSEDPTRLQTLPYMVVMFAGICVFSVVFSMKRQKPLFESLVVKIDDEKIVREKLKTPTITIYKNEITKITKTNTGAYAIVGKSQLNLIGIPPQINDGLLLEAALNQLQPVTVLTAKTFLEKMFIPISLSGALLMGVTFVSTNQTVNLICSILIVLILSASITLVQLSKNVDARTKRLSWIGLIPTIVFLSGIIEKISR